MKKFIAAFIALALICLALPASAGMVDTVTGLAIDDTNPLFKQAARKEQIHLDYAKDNVLTRVNELVEDGVVKSAKMEKLYQAINLYHDDARKAKAVYGNLVIVDLNPKIDQTVDWYYAPLLYNGSKHQVEIKKNIAELTGVNIHYIQEDFAFGVLAIFILVMILLGAVATVFEKEGYPTAAVFVGVLCGATIIFTLTVLFGA